MESRPSRFFVFVFFALISCISCARLACAAQPNITGSDAISIKQSLDRLSVTGSVLMIAAHPDDENTALLSYLARGRHVRTAYLSLTRGEGGQNGIGPEQGPELGVIRTQELLQSRRIDGAQQFFTRAIDFGFSKNPGETIEKWGHDAVLGDVVWVIRRFRPDVVILQFTGTPSDGHGQHQASSILGREAFAAAADPTKFPEQLKFVQPWRAQRLMMNRRAFDPAGQKQIAALPEKIDLDLGGYDPLLGYSYGELAGISRSFNSSQSEGTPRVRGSNRTTLVTVAGPPAKKDLFDNMDLTWRRYKNGDWVRDLLQEAESAWNPERPDELIPILAKVRDAMDKVDTPEVKAKVRALDELIANCAGLWLDLAVTPQNPIAGGSETLRVTAIRRTAIPVTVIGLKVSGTELSGAKNVTLEENVPYSVENARAAAKGADYTQPYWLIDAPVHDLYTVRDKQSIGLAENPPVLNLQAALTVGGVAVSVERAAVYRYINQQSGESITPLAYLPPVSVKCVQRTVVVADDKLKQVQVEVTAHVPHAKGKLEFNTPSGWRIHCDKPEFAIEFPGEQSLIAVTAVAEPGAASGTLNVAAVSNGERYNVGVEQLSYPHIPIQTMFPKAEAMLVRTHVATLAKRVGYVMGSGDDMPDALRQLGIEVVLLDANTLARGELGKFDAIVTGIRAYTLRPDLNANQQRLLDYVSAGGTLIVQYNRRERNAPPLDHLGPYPFEVGSGRVTVEDAPVRFDSSKIVLDKPNKITPADFMGWVQERGLYFPSKWDAHYDPLFSMNDPGESPLAGSTLIAKYGRGVYCYTALSWFRQLPAGVPGAYRIFANLLSAAKEMSDGNAVASRSNEGGGK